MSPPAAQPLGPVGPPLTGRQIMSQDWVDLTFLHWRVDPGVVAPLMPRGVRPDVHDGSTWVGLVPFTISRAGVGRGPAVPWWGTFPETNVRLYSIDEQGRRGVVFRSLEASRLAVVLGARTVFNLPYRWARMSITRSVVEDLELDYRTSRRLAARGARRAAGGAPVGGRVLVRVGDRIAEPAPLQLFLTSRWGLHTSLFGRTVYVPNNHGVWPLHEATLLHRQDTLVAAAGLPGVVDTPPESVLFSPGVHAFFGLPHLAGRPRAS